MPELPEVEMVARHLCALVQGRTFTKAQLLHPSIAPEHSPRQFAAQLRGARVTEVARRGKHILTHLSNGRTLLTHLRMTGRFLLVGRDDECVPHTHAIFWLDDGHKLLYADPRRFGRMLIVNTPELGETRALRQLAPEPFDQIFTPEYLHATLQRSRLPIKLFLLDQRRVVGLGNIYVAEALYRARVNPRLPAQRLSRPRTVLLHQEIINVLNEAIANDSTLNTDPRQLDASYTGGKYESMTRVYDRAGQPCLTCGAPIRRFTQGGRSTYHCPRCQRR
jgi:formamidopyrimidine-DNA glycosylase